jgi:cell division protein FtsQ
MMRVIEVARRAGWRGVAVLVALVGIGSSPWWGPPLLSRLSYFQLRHVEVDGQRYVLPADILARLRVDTNTSVWTDLGVLERRVAEHPQVRAVTIDRRLPGTLVVRLTENLPVALVPTRAGLAAVDAQGELLPIDPSRTDVDLPVLQRADTALLALLSELRAVHPRLFDRIGTARHTGRDEVTFTLASLAVRAPAGVSARRLADIIPVEQDLARRRARVAELDLRFRDQVIARLQ